MLATLGPNATKNGDISIAPKLMAARGWTSRSSLNAAMIELVSFGLITKTRQGSRLDCSLFAVTLYPLNCDMKKLDVSSEMYAGGRNETTEITERDRQIHQPYVRSELKSSFENNEAPSFIVNPSN
jgi:hypothetical protein